MKLYAIVVAFVAFVSAQKLGKAPLTRPGKSTNGNSQNPPQAGHAAVETNDPQTPPVLTNAVTDWMIALAESIDTVQGVSNHHHARWMGLTGEVIVNSLNALTQQRNSALTDDVVVAYAAHQFISYNFEQWQSGHLDTLLNVYLNYTSGPYPYLQELENLVLPIVRDILNRETSSGITNFVQRYIAPSTIGANRSTLQQYQGIYQFTDPATVNVSYKGRTVSVYWQERGHFGTIRPFFGPLIDYVTGSNGQVDVKPPLLTSNIYKRDYAEIQAYGSNDKRSKDGYNYNTPIYWLQDWSHFPVIWREIARAHLPRNLSNYETARFFAALGEGIFEATNVNYGMKWGQVANTTSFWRPETAIRSGDTYGHSAVRSWTPQLITPEHPDFPSGHCAHSGAAAQILRHMLGRDNISMVIHSDYSDHNPNLPYVPNRRFTSLSQIEADIVDARVFGGVHWRNSCEIAHVLAYRAADSAWAHFYGGADPSHRSTSNANTRALNNQTMNAHQTVSQQPNNQQPSTIQLPQTNGGKANGGKASGGNQQAQQTTTTTTTSNRQG